MNTTNDITPDNPLAQVEQWLVAAGFSYTVVDSCPHPACELCQAGSVPAAA